MRVLVAVPDAVVLEESGNVTYPAVLWEGGRLRALAVLPHRRPHRLALRFEGTPPRASENDPIASLAALFGAPVPLVRRVGPTRIGPQALPLAGEGGDTCPKGWPPPLWLGAAAACNLAGRHPRPPAELPEILCRWLTSRGAGGLRPGLLLAVLWGGLVEVAGGPMGGWERTVPPLHVGRRLLLERFPWCGGGEGRAALLDYTPAGLRLLTG